MGIGVHFTKADAHIFISKEMFFMKLKDTGLTAAELKEKASRYIIETYERFDFVADSAKGIYVYDDSGSKHTELVMDAPKSPDSIRDIPVPAELIQQLIPYKNMAGDEAFVLSGKKVPIEPRVYRTFYKRLLRRAGLPNIRFHALRHSFATRCIDGNCDYKTVSALLGHSNISTTLNLYVHPSIDQKRKVVESMSAVLK